MTPDDPLKAIETIWKRHDETTRVVQDLVANYSLLTHRIGALEQGQSAQTQRMVELRMELLSTITHGDANIVSTVKEYQTTVQSLLAAHHQQMGAKDSSRWLMGLLVSIASLAIALHIIRGPWGA